MMYCVQDSKFEDATSAGQFRFGKLGTVCPLCSRAAWFVFDPPVDRSDVLSEPRRVTCGGCGGSVAFYVISKPDRNKTGWLWAHPSPANEHVHSGEIAAALEVVDPALREAYDEATATLASGHASSAAIQARRTLEGLVKHLLEDGKVAKRAALDELIRTLADRLELAKPLTDTAHAVREGGNLGAHYDTRITASSELAARTVELVEAIVDYLLVLPRKVEDLRRLLEDEPADDEEASDSS